MSLKLIVVFLITVMGHFVQPFSVFPSNQTYPEPPDSTIVNNPCNPMLDQFGINITVEPVNSSLLYNQYIDIPNKDKDFDQWHFLRIDCSKRNGTPINVSYILTPQMQYIIALVNCTIDSSRIPPSDVKESDAPIDILFVNCTVNLTEIHTSSGLIFQSSTLPRSFFSRRNSKLIFLESRVKSSFDLTIANWMTKLVVLPDKQYPFQGKIQTFQEGGVGECLLDNSKMTIDLDANFNLIRQCGLKNNITLVWKSIESNLDVIIFMVFSMLAIISSKLDPKQRPKPLASLLISFVSTYSAVSRIIIALSTQYVKKNSTIRLSILSCSCQ
ncbi:hypothetical protein BKA69DRAFT_1042670 [Paraphysoderma sedebokerense]|nr:hypothetical protein BKA69DRAFT_1042670 [Paraphysoderma sedebokerense]